MNIKIMEKIQKSNPKYVTADQLLEQYQTIEKIMVGLSPCPHPITTRKIDNDNQYYDECDICDYRFN